MSDDVYIRIIETHMEDFSDFVGSTEFKNGVSVNPVSQVEAERLAACFKVETIDGKDPSVNARYEAVYHSEEPPVTFPPNTVLIESQQPIVFDFTRESLEALADEKGINGVREVAKRYGVKSNSIVGLIGGLMALKGEEKA